MRKILVFGGNGFMGGETVVELLSSKQYDITVVNRGHWDHFDSNRRVRPFVNTIQLDRKSWNAVEKLRTAVTNDLYDVVIDFSAYDSDVIRDTLQVLHNRIKLYIYISTDSVYEVCQTSAHNLSSEVDSIRPNEREEYERLRKKDSYGHKKLKAEEYLIEQQALSNDQWSYVILRLPDVLGPRDSTDRWWFYQMWIQFYVSLNKPIELSTDIVTSYVFVNDIARYINHILSETILNSSDIFHNQILNLACQETVSIRTLIDMIIDELNLKTLQIEIRSNPHTNADFFPSVTRGALDISKALSNKFSWKPTALRQVIHQTVQWYNDAYRQFPNERKNMAKFLRRTLLKDDDDTYEKLLADMDLYCSDSRSKRKGDEEPFQKKIKSTFDQSERDSCIRKEHL